MGERRTDQAKATPHHEQIIRKLREAERMLAQVPEVAKALEV